MTTFNEDVRSEDFDTVLGEEGFALGEQTADIPSSSSIYFNTQQDTIYQPPFRSNLNLDLNYTPEFGRPSDWTLPPSLTPLTDLESLSSSVSGGVYPDPTWNPFEFTFSGVNSTINNGAFVSRNPYDSNNFKGSSHRNEYPGLDDRSYVSLTSIHQPLDAPHFEYDTERSGGENLMISQGPYQFQSFPTSPLESPVLAPNPQTQNRQPAWGHSRSRGSSSSTSSRSQAQKRRKSIEQNEVQTSRLRSTGSYRAGTSSASGTFSTMNAKGDNSKTRTNHNQIEKHYRNRLNSQFEVLLAMLPREEGAPLPVRRDSEGKEEVGADRVEERKISKAEVLEMAQKHIRRLEREGKDMDSENKLLKMKMGELNRLWVESGGVVMP